jgi:SAM-dependent methyltransferase
VSDRLERTRRSYDRLATRYRERRRDRSAMVGFIDAFASVLDSGARIVDVGCGPGFDAAELRSRGFRVIALDRSWGMLRAGVEEWPGPRVQADMRALPLSAGIDGLWVSASMLHVERADAPATLAGFRRALMPGGRLFLLLKAGEGAGWDEKPYGVDAPRWFTYWGEDEIDAALEAAGFEVERLANHLPNEQPWIARIARAVE